MVDNPPKEFQHLEPSNPSGERGETQRALYQGAQA